MHTTLSRLSILVLCVSTCAVAQELPNPKPGKAHKLLAQEVGSWDCDVKMFFQGPNGPPAEYKGLEVNKLVSGDLYLQTTFTCRMGEREFEGHSLFGYDPRAEQYVGTWVDNFTTTPTNMKGKYDAETKTLTVYSTLFDDEGNELQQKQVTTWTNEAKKKFAIFLVIEAARQLREECEGRQVADPKIACVHGTGGVLGVAHSGATLLLARG